MKVNLWFMYYTADTLFALAFGKPFDMIRKAKGHWFLDMIHDGSKALAFFGPIPWMFPLANSIPALNPGDLRARKWAEEQVRERQAMQIDEPDIMSWLLDPLEQMTHDEKENEAWLMADARLLITAGTGEIFSVQCESMFPESAFYAVDTSPSLRPSVCH